MARRKRASMRDGPLADLFRSTVREDRVEDLQDVPAPKERLSRIFAEEHDVEGPAYGREEPGLSDYHGPPRPHMPVIRVVGVGGAGVNAINRMIEAQVPGVEFMAINTDLQSLQQSTADV